MTKYRNSLPALALAITCSAMLSIAGQASAQALDEAFRPRSVPGVEYASLDVPVAKARAAMATAAPGRAPATPLAVRPPEAGKAPAEKSLWQRTKNFFGFK